MGQHVNLQAVATAAHLSLATVSKILSGKYKGNTPKGRERVARVQGLAEHMGYIANATARRLRLGAHHALVVVTPVDDSGHPPVFISEFIFGINHALREKEWGMILYSYPRVAGIEVAQRLPKERFYDGALVIDSFDGVDSLLARAGVPAAFINVDPGPGRLTFMRDERAAGADLTRALAGLGYNRLLVVGEIGLHPNSHSGFLQRWEGIQRAARECGVEIDTLPDAWWQGTIPRTLPTARIDPGTVIVAMDVHTVWVLTRILPPGTPLACCDDCHLLHETFNELTRVVHERMALGRMAADRLLARIANPLTNPLTNPLANPLAEPNVAPLRGAVLIGATTPAFAK